MMVKQESDLGEAEAGDYRMVTPEPFETFARSKNSVHDSLNSRPQSK